jgi:hypothetical protein
MLSDSDDTGPLSDADLIQAVTSSGRSWSPPSIDDPMTWGKHKGLSYRAMAARDPGYARWAASKIPGLRGQLSAEALALHLGVVE